MQINLAKAYFSKLLNTAVDENTVITLSSGQGARALAWLETNNISIDNLQLSSGFTLNQLNGNKENPKNKLKVSAEVNSATNCSNLAAFDKISIGIDIQSISELFPHGMPLDPKSDNELLGIYTLKELSYAESKGNPTETLTGLFAAKEAIQKCSDHEIKLTSIEILPDPRGKPCTAGYSVSISHSRDYALAVATPSSARNAGLFAAVKTDLPSISHETNHGNKRKKVLDFFMPIAVLILIIIEAVRIIH